LEFRVESGGGFLDEVLVLLTVDEKGGVWGGFLAGRDVFAMGEECLGL